MPLKSECPSSPVHEQPPIAGCIEGTDSVTDQYLLGNKPGRAAGRLWLGRAARHSHMAAHGLLCLGALQQMLRRHGAGGWWRLRSTSGQPGCAWRHCARGPWLCWQLGNARRLLACCTWWHALPCKSFDALQPLTVWHADWCTQRKPGPERIQTSIKLINSRTAWSAVSCTQGGQHFRKTLPLYKSGIPAAADWAIGSPPGVPGAGPAGGPSAEAGLGKLPLARGWPMDMGGANGCIQPRECQQTRTCLLSLSTSSS